MNMTEIAEKLGVSQSTVSRVLNNRDKGRVSPKTAEMIRQYIQESGFVRNSQASTLRTGRSNVMGLILPWNVPELMDTIERECAREGVDLLVQFTPEPDSELEQKALDVMLQHQVDFLIWEPYITCDIRLIERARASIRNVAILGDHPQVEETIRFDYENGFRKIYRYALQNGYRQIVIVGLSGNTSVRIPDPGEIAESPTVHRMVDLERKSLRKFLIPGTLLVSWNDWFGIELFEYLEAEQIAVPGEVGIIVMGDLLLGNRYRLGDLFRYPFPSLKRDFAAMGLAAVRRAMAGSDDLPGPVYIGMDLNLRSSSMQKP